MDTNIKSFTIIVNEASIRNNHLKNGDFQFAPDIKKHIRKREEENSYEIEIKVEIHDSENNPFPFNLAANISGLFEIEGEDNKEINNFLQTQGVQMVYPHLRSLVANLTTAAMMPPLLLPIIYVNEFDEN